MLPSAHRGLNHKGDILAEYIFKYIFLIDICIMFPMSHVFFLRSKLQPGIGGQNNKTKTITSINMAQFSAWYMRSKPYNTFPSNFGTSLVINWSH